MVYYALNICPEPKLGDIGSLCRGAGLHETDPLKMWKRDNQNISLVAYGGDLPLLVQAYEQTPQVIEFVSKLVEVTGATEVYHHYSKDIAQPYDPALFLPIMVANSFKGSKSNDKDRRLLSITELGTMQSDSVVNFLMPIAKGELRVRQKKWYFILTDYNYTHQDQCTAINSLRKIATKNEKAQQFLENEMHLTI